jgi:hypothetical protein
MEASNHSQSDYLTEENELTLKDIILLVQDYLKEILRRWKVFPIIIIPITCLLLYNAISYRTVYPGQITFIVTEDEADGGGIADILGSLGGGGKDESALEKVLQLFRSRRIIENTLFEKITIDGEEKFIANHIINEYGLDDLLSDYKSFGGLTSAEWIKVLNDKENYEYVHEDKEKFDLAGKQLMKVLYNRIVGNTKLGIEPIINSTIDEKSGIMSIYLSTVNEELTAEMLLKLYDRLSQYYIDKTVEKQKKIYDIAQFKADSIQVELSVADRSLAEFEDANRNLVWVRGELKRTKLQRQARLLEGFYSATVQQLEMADFALRRKTPYVQIIDEPARPINPQGKSKSQAIILGLGIGFFIGLIYIVVRKFFKDILSEN